jgi:hypothetical protein
VNLLFNKITTVVISKSKRYTTDMVVAKMTI